MKRNEIVNRKSKVIKNLCEHQHKQRERERVKLRQRDRDTKSEIRMTNETKPKTLH